MNLEQFGHFMAAVIFIDWCWLIYNQRVESGKIQKLAGSFHDDLVSVFKAYEDKINLVREETDAKIDVVVKENQVLRDMLKEANQDLQQALSRPGQK